ncbi:carbohydrate ABC transporter permease [Paenibacillus gansuensis]|uniref:Carbohydrate ABC transporter permease n=1 Tax=Paenibacillus gansuensis TaxID=306542 RepID=A0ABW5PFB7_9BACL
MGMSPGAARAVLEPRKRRLQRSQSKIIALLFLLPAVAIFGFFLWYPIYLGIRIGFLNYDLVKDPVFVGLDNYRTVLHDPLLGKAIWNTLKYMVYGLVIGYLLPVIVAVWIAEMRRFQNFFRMAVYIPAVLPGIAIYTLWRWMYEPQGLLNTWLGYIGIDRVPWIMSEVWSMFSMVLMDTWAGFGATAILYIAALGAISEETYEAAEIDGAGVWRRIYHITIPGMRNVMLVLLVLQLIGTAQAFQSMFVVTEGGPNNSTLTVLYLIYRYAFVYFKFGPAAALGTLFFVALALLSAVYLLLTRKKEGV